MKRIKLTQGKYALVDDKDYEELNKHKWYFANYAIRQVGGKGVFMHKVIMPAPKGMHTDHINRDKLDNRKQNLRVCTHAENNRNTTTMWKTNRSGYKGVTFNKKAGKYVAQIKEHGNYRFLGHYDVPEEASLAYKEAALKYHGNFASI